MPFERYLKDDNRQNRQNIPVPPQPAHPEPQYQPDHLFGRQAPQRPAGQVPSFGYVHPEIQPVLYHEAPTLGAPGGGAELLPVGLHDHTNPWLSATYSPFFDPYAHLNKQQQFQDDPTTSTALDQPRSFPLQNPFSSRGPTSPQDLEPFVNPEFLAHFQEQQRQQQRQQQSQVEALAQIHYTPPPVAQPTPTSVSIDLAQSPGTQIPTIPISRLVAPSPHGLPVYSASGLDILSILARVVNRPNPQVELGPVDLTCSFVVVDVRLEDHPIIYCSPTFCQLTGYTEKEIRWKNCRFLQSPDGVLRRGESRRFTSPEAVAHLHKNLSANKECQASIVNYKKGGKAFINLVTVIPVAAEDGSNEIVYHVGFQVNLNEQPNAILQKLQDGSYMVDYPSRTTQTLLGTQLRERRSHFIPSAVISKDLEKILENPKFIQSIPISTAANLPPTSSSSSSASSTAIPPLTTSLSPLEKAEPMQEHGHQLNLILLEAMPDFLLVVSLKGRFLYVAPSVRRVLGYESQELVGKEIQDFAHPEDVVPLMRELKESSTTGTAILPGTVLNVDASGSSSANDFASFSFFPLAVHTVPRTVDLLFRARTKSGVYVWVECRGRLHVEPGKGRKAIILSGRAKFMGGLEWRSVAEAGGVVLPKFEKETTKGKGKGEEERVEKATDPGGGQEGDGGGGGTGDASSSPSQVESESLVEPSRPIRTIVEREFWGMLSPTGDFLVVGSGVHDVLGWDASDIIGKDVGVFIAGDDTEKKKALVDEIGRISLAELMPEDGNGKRKEKKEKYSKMRVGLKKKDGGVVETEVVLYAPTYGFVDVEPGTEDSTPSRAVEMEAKMLVQKYYQFPGSRVKGECVAVRPPPVAYQVKLLDCGDVEASPERSVQTPTQNGQTLTPTPNPSLTHPLSSNVFEEMMISRGSSWQYEVEKLKLENQRLLDEIEMLEGKVEVVEAMKASGASLDGVSILDMDMGMGMGGGGEPGDGERPGELMSMAEYSASMSQQQQQQQQQAGGPFGVPSMFAPPPMDRLQYGLPSALPYPYGPRHVVGSGSEMAMLSMPSSVAAAGLMPPPSLSLQRQQQQQILSPLIQQRPYPHLHPHPHSRQSQSQGQSLYRPLSTAMGPSSSPFCLSPQMPSVRSSVSVLAGGSIASSSSSSSSSGLKRSWGAVEP
ncbi:hypothetical protein BDN72DRAFT_345448 [Pluteus cervinus]|uniref:Uncharacterized protein n=1 Tax=Pluteus cervinus TaxID=181527 RepID=A0ACD3ABF8_9AGAR|nr:hypothetical protein BDN72DRAFT_345448 [Pluteus cervinus]